MYYLENITAFPLLTLQLQLKLRKYNEGRDRDLYVRTKYNFFSVLKVLKVYKAII